MAKITGKKKIFSTVGIIFLFLVISSIYFFPRLQGQLISQSDIIQFQGMSKELADYREATGDEAIWTNSMFGGMPGYLILTDFKGNLLEKAINLVLKIPRPISYQLLLFVFFFAMLMLLGVNRWLSFAGALAYGFTSFFFVILESGHNTKAHTIAYLALIVGGIIFAYRRNRIWGGIVTAIGLSWMIHANHLQMTYYAGILTLIIIVAYFTEALKEKTLLPFIKTSGVLLFAAVLAVGTNVSNLWPVYEYSQETIRGESELTQEGEENTSGLDSDYILDYSYDLGETLTAFIPRFKGGSMSESLGEDSNVYQLLSSSQGRQNALRIANNLPLYWGSQPIAGGPFYYGAVLCFLFVFGLFIVKGVDKWWIVAAVIISFLLSLGKYLPSLSHFMIDYFPLYNKFRDVKNIIIIQQFAMAFLGVWAVREIYLRKIDNQKLKKGLLYSFVITGGLALLFSLFPGIAGNYTGASDAQLLQAGWPEQLMDALRDDRRMALRNDAFRSFIFVALAAAGIWAFWERKLKAEYALVVWVILILADTWPVNKRYLNNDDFVPAREMETPYTASQADEMILQDDAISYRVLNLTVSPFTDASTSYFHQSIGGYHAAKLMRYQELIENHIYPEIQILGNALNSGQTSGIWEQTPVINMLNGKYIIVNPNGAPIQNPSALGNAWFVDDYQIVANANEEIAVLNDFQPGQTAIIDERFEEIVEGKSFEKDTAGFVTLTEYQPNYLKYESEASSEQLAVFSEIYYDKGWKAFIDGEEVPHFRVNYVLRAMVIPFGNHSIEFRFEPQSYYLGNKISLASSLLLILIILGFAIMKIKKGN